VLVNAKVDVGRVLEVDREPAVVDVAEINGGRVLEVNGESAVVDITTVVEVAGDVVVEVGLQVWQMCSSRGSLPMSQEAASEVTLEAT